ncbi:MAG: FtsB family cell division protein [Solirubrobacterales bacterium]
MTARAHAARPSSRRRRRTRVNWDRLGRVVLVVVLFAVLASYLNPVVNFVDAWRDSKSTKQELQDLAVENAQLRARTADNSTDAVMVREARKLGMVRPGERSYVIHDLPH